MKLSENFTLEEMIYSSTAQKRGINNYPDLLQLEKLQLLCNKILQPLRNKLKKPITITSAFRCDELNRIVGGSKTSQHLKGEAADIICNDNSQLWNLALELIYNGDIVVGQIINEKNLSWIHISLPSLKHINQILYL